MWFQATCLQPAQHSVWIHPFFIFLACASPLALTRLSCERVNEGERKRGLMKEMWGGRARGERGIKAKPGEMHRCLRQIIGSAESWQRKGRGERGRCSVTAGLCGGMIWVTRFSASPLTHTGEWSSSPPSCCSFCWQHEMQGKNKCWN